MIWTANAVWSREVEAQDTIARLPVADFTRVRSNWPSALREFADAVGAEETRDPRDWPEDWKRKGPPLAAAIDRMHEVWAWHAWYLRTEIEQCRILQRVARAAAFERPLLSGVKGLGYSKWFVYRARDRALEAIANGLSRDGHPSRGGQEIAA